jgi:hypothetical protein
MITLTGYFIGLPVESVLRIALRPPHAMEFTQVRGTLRALAGQCSLRAVEDGTEVHYRLEADPAIPMITDEAARQFLVQFVERMLDRIKLAAQRKAPARRAERAVAAPAADVEAEDDDADTGAEGVMPGGLPQRSDASPAPDVEPQAVVAAPLPSETGPGPHRADTKRSGRRRRRRRHRGRGPAGRGPAPPAPGGTPPPA